MKKYDLNSIPELLNNNEISEEEAAQYMAVFIQENHKVFLLDSKEKDFISDVILYFLERAVPFIKKFDSSYGSFFNYFYCFIKSAKKTIKRKKHGKTLSDYHSLTESILGYSYKQEIWSKLDYKSTSLTLKPKVPYRYNKIDVEAFQLACHSDEYKITKYTDKAEDENSQVAKLFEKFSPMKVKKILLVLALKSAWYIEDYQIRIISEICGLKYNILLDVIQSLKEELTVRLEHKKELEIRRNKAYYHRRTYSNLIQYLKDDNDYFSREKLKIVTHKYIRHTESWNNLNLSFRKGVINIRPTNKTVSEIMGICERQVSYYIRNVHELYFG